MSAEEYERLSKKIAVLKEVEDKSKDIVHYDGLVIDEIEERYDSIILY